MIETNNIPIIDNNKTVTLVNNQIIVKNIITQPTTTTSIIIIYAGVMPEPPQIVSKCVAIRVIESTIG